VTVWVTANRWDVQLQLASAGAGSVLSAGYNVAATASDAFFLAISVADGAAAASSVSHAVVSVGTAQSSAAICGSALSPYLDVTDGSTGSTVATQLPCLSECLAGKWLCEGLGSLAGNRYCSAAQVTNDSEVVNCKQVDSNTILDTDFDRDNFSDSLGSGNNTLTLDENNDYTESGLVMPSAASAPASAPAVWR